MPKHPSLSILKALIIGQEIELDGRIYLLDKNDNDKWELVIKGRSYRNGIEQEAVYLPMDISLTGFMNLCESMDEDNLFLINAQTALTEYHREFKCLI